MYYIGRRWLSSNNSSFVRIGSVIGKRNAPIPQSSPFLPRNYFENEMSPSLMGHLQWMLQKDALGQDMLLIGPPGAGAVFRRRLALAFCELLQRETQLLALTQDTTESDLKQRRELVQKSTNSLDLEFVDQPPVSAAIHGRFLILDGLEKAERNVLPTLNNLLEHREMHLEDGRFLVSPSRYEMLSKNEYSNEQLVPTHEDFRVIALAVPNPPFTSLARSIDPPLRSRFQIRRVDPLPSSELLPILNNRHPMSNNTSSIATLVGVMNEAASQNIQVRPFPVHALTSKDNVNDLQFSELLQLYAAAHSDWGNEASQKALETAWSETMHGTDFSTNEDFVVETVEKRKSISEQVAVVELQNISNYYSDQKISITVPCGSQALQDIDDSPQPYVLTTSMQGVFASMIRHHQSRDLLLVSSSGEGKSATANYFSRRLGYTVHLVHLFPEMTSRDLLLRRSTCPITGETTWEDSELIKSARNGNLCILDGVDKLRPNVLASLQSLCVDRDIFLPDGRRMMLDSKQITPNDDEKGGGIIPINPSFRIIALASPPDSSTKNKNFLDEAMDLFATIFIKAGPNSDEEACTRAILASIKNPKCPNDTITKLLSLRNRLTADLAEDCGVAPLSKRNLIRVVRRVHSNDDLANILMQSIFVADLLPPSQRATLERILKDCGIQVSSSSGRRHFMSPRKQAKTEVEVNDESCKIGDFVMYRQSVARPEMVPAPKFFDIPYHISTIKDLLRDWSRGERAFLLLGNQGVGKNMILDRLCQLANFEREYIQLHRDSTVGQITLQPTLEEGKVVWKDSPLLRAVRDGLTLVVDEADKAPTEVLSVLKGLVEDGELLLADGRRISRHVDSASLSQDIIPIHPDFTLWILANRPGFPFLGNEFFRLVGDCFSTRVIANPDLDSEIRLLTEYGPDVDPALVRKVAASFAELRHLSDVGDLSYPYSTREAVAVIKHLNQYPDDGIIAALHNILDFDSYEDTVYTTLAKVFQQHDIPVESYGRWKEAIGRHTKSLEIEVFGERSAEGTSSSPPPLSDPKRGKWDDKNEAHVGGNQWAGGTGGSDTAGLGGRGGPYRLDRGHKVHQVSEEDKAKVSEETKRKSRAIAQKALKEKLDEINMSRGDWNMYQKFTDPIRSDIVKLRSILNQIEMKQKERGWIKQQSHGELDDNKIVDSVVGERYIYKRRGIVEDSESFSRPKRLRFVMDCSASMYRFNGYDERLTRELEVTNLIMESFAGMDQRFDYSIVGHSGDSPAIPLVNFGQPPANEKERMQVLQTMLAHTQFCQSGDHTLTAMGQAISSITLGADENDTSLVIALSDANLERYGIRPRTLAKIMEAGDVKQVKSHCIFLASFGPEAEEIRRELPPGRGHVCMSTQDLPRIVRDILTSNT